MSIGASMDHPLPQQTGFRENAVQPVNSRQRQGATLAGFRGGGSADIPRYPACGGHRAKPVLPGIADHHIPFEGRLVSPRLSTR